MNYKNNAVKMLSKFKFTMQGVPHSHIRTYIVQMTVQRFI